jgi:hypothetical protein
MISRVRPTVQLLVRPVNSFVNVVTDAQRKFNKRLGVFKFAAYDDTCDASPLLLLRFRITTLSNFSFGISFLFLRPDLELMT